MCLARLQMILQFVINEWWSIAAISASQQLQQIAFTQGLKFSKMTDKKTSIPKVRLSIKLTEWVSARANSDFSLISSSHLHESWIGAMDELMNEVIWKDLKPQASGVDHKGMQYLEGLPDIVYTQRGALKSPHYPWNVIRGISARESSEFHGQFIDWSTQLQSLLRLLRDKRARQKENDWKNTWNPVCRKFYSLQEERHNSNSQIEINMV